VVVKLRAFIEKDEKPLEDLFSTIVGSTDESVQSVSTEAIHAFLLKHDSSFDRAKVDKLFLRKYANSAAAASKAVEDKKKSDDDKVEKKDEDATMDEKKNDDDKVEKKDEDAAMDDKAAEAKDAAADKAPDAAAEEEEDDDDGYISKSDLEGMTVAVLKTLCKAQGLGVSGKKEDLVKQLHEVYEKAAKEKAAKKEAAAEKKKEADAAAAAAKAKEEAEAAETKAKEEAEAKEAEMTATLAKAAEAAAAKMLDTSGKEVSKEDFNRIVRMYYKVVRQCVLSDNLLIEKSAQIRRMEVGEILEVFRGPLIDTSVGVYRLMAKTVKDGSTGWATIAGNQGITFLMPGGRIFTVKKACPFTVEKKDLDGSSGLIRTLQPGEFLEVMEWARTSQSPMGVTRIQARAQGDGAIGWATVTGNDGNIYLEAM